MQQPAQLQTRARTSASGWYLAGRALVNATFQEKLFFISLFIHLIFFFFSFFTFILFLFYFFDYSDDGLAEAPFLKGM